MPLYKLSIVHRKIDNEAEPPPPPEEEVSFLANPRTGESFSLTINDGTEIFNITEENTTIVNKPRRTNYDVTVNTLPADFLLGGELSTSSCVIVDQFGEFIRLGTTICTADSFEHFHIGITVEQRQGGIILSSVNYNGNPSYPFSFVLNPLATLVRFSVNKSVVTDIGGCGECL